MKTFYFALALASFGTPHAMRPVKAQQLAPTRVEKTISVFINGEVRKPNTYQVPANATLNALLALAGGPTNDAALSQVMVYRRGETTRIINVHAILGKIPADFALQNDDTVVVPRNKNRILVMGNVQHPGNYAIPEGRTLSIAGALALAGHITKEGSKTEVTLIQKPEATKKGEYSEPRVTHNVKQNQLLQSGDMIYVPQIKQRLKTKHGTRYAKP